MKRIAAIAVIITAGALGLRLFLALHYPNDEPDDGRIYAQIARNILEHGSYSLEGEEPYKPTFIRVPGYPLFLAGVYSIFGHGNNRAVRIVQAVLDTATCWVVALLAFFWAPVRLSGQPPIKCYTPRRALVIALAMASVCPFTAIYVTTILTEVCATFFLALLALATTMALRCESEASIKSIGWWLAAGLLGGIATMLRPDSGMFTAAAGLTLSAIYLRRAFAEKKLQPVKRAFACGLALSIGFAIAIAPWTIRNARVFRVFQPIAPLHANMPDEFVPRGYNQWLRTWIDHSRYVETFEFNLDVKPIRIEDVPDSAFDSPEERARVAALFDRYNASAGSVAKGEVEASSDEDEEAGGSEPHVQMTPEIDAEFGQIARERIARHPIRYYLILPMKRALTIWFDNHSEYYPFQGDLFPLSDLDSSIHQQYWLPLFALLVWVYTILALIGCWLMFRHGGRRWVLFLLLLILPRLAFLSLLENPEPRYVVEYFALLAAAGSLPPASIRLRKSTALWKQSSAALN
jgi:hypothetical protein